MRKKNKYLGNQSQTDRSTLIQWLNTTYERVTGQNRLQGLNEKHDGDYQRHVHDLKQTELNKGTRLFSRNLTKAVQKGIAVGAIATTVVMGAGAGLQYLRDHPPMDTYSIHLRLMKDMFPIERMPMSALVDREYHFFGKGQYSAPLSESEAKFFLHSDVDSGEGVGVSEVYTTYRERLVEFCKFADELGIDVHPDNKEGQALAAKLFDAKYLKGVDNTISHEDSLTILNRLSHKRDELMLKAYGTLDSSIPHSKTSCEVAENR